MEKKLAKHYSDFRAGKVGHNRGGVRIAEMLIQPFCWRKPDISHS